MSWVQRVEQPLNSGVSAADLSSQLGLPLWVATVLHHRMHQWTDQSLEAARRFLEPSLKFLPDPFGLPDMDRAAERLAEAIVEGQKIAIYGDYDVDGTVGSALLRRFLRMLKTEPEVYQPDRQKEGYGVNRAAIERLATGSARLLITVDCGITNIAEVERANELGMDVIICDHHEPKEQLPPAYAVLDHKRADNESSIRSLCGAGVAFYLAMATRSVLRDIGHFEEGLKEPDLRELLDLVALATVADMVPLIEENRVLVKFGMDRIRRAPSVGLRELLSVAGINHAEVSPYHFGFVIGPRINASGRLGSASHALELLSTDNAETARLLASQLQGVNEERMRLQNDVAEEALAQAAAQLQERGEDWPALVLTADHWHEGVIGIVASKVIEKFHRPVAVLTFATHSGFGKASARAPSGFDLVAALEKCAECLKGFGGHKAAAGFSLEKEQLGAFQEKFAEAMGEQGRALTGGASAVVAAKIMVDVELADDIELNAAAVVALERLAPFGMGNAEPVVMVSGWKISGVKTLKERHLKIQFSHATKGLIEGFWANGSGKLASESGPVEILGLPQINNFRNLNRVELKIKNVRAP